MLIVILLNIIYTFCHCDLGRYADCHYAKCRYADGRGASFVGKFSRFKFFPFFKISSHQSLIGLSHLWPIL
jgi:hypothetical protein